MTIGDRVKIKSTDPTSGQPSLVACPGDPSPFAGRTGRVVGYEMDGRTRLYRVWLDRPVDVPGVGLVTDDLWSGPWLRKIKPSIFDRRR